MTADTLVRQKAAIRKAILDQRRTQDARTREGKSRDIVRSLVKSEEFGKARALLIYLSNPEEVATDELMAEAFQAGKRVLVPVVNTPVGELDVSELPGPDVALRSGPFGIREPGTDVLNIVSPDQVDLVVVPGIAFDRRGGRIGYGKGYYDRLLGRLGEQVPRVGLAFEFQVLDSVPQNESDRRVDIVITEKNIMNCSGRN